MSNLRRPPGPVRQLSLQQPPRRQQVRRQRSAEDEKPLQVFANPIRTRLQYSDRKHDHDRPEVRVAWDENHETMSNSVAVIARQIPGKLRPPTARAKVTTRPVISEKASILYSRQELAERLRLAWKQREENRANIDIFLAQNAVESSCESRPSSCATSAPSARKKDPVSEPRTTRAPRRTMNTEPLVKVASSASVKVTPVRQELQEDGLKLANVTPENAVVPAKLAADVLLKKLEISTGTAQVSGQLPPRPSGGGAVLFFENPSRDDEETGDKQNNWMNLLKEEIAANDESCEDENGLHLRDEITRFGRESKAEDEVTEDVDAEDWPPCLATTGNGDKKAEVQQNGSATDLPTSAKAKRANFSNHGGNLHRAFTSGPVPVPVSERRERLTGSKDSQHSVGFPIMQDSKTRRTNSAPPQQRRQPSSVVAGGRTQVSIVIDAPSIGPSTQEFKSEVVPAPDAVVKAAIANRTIKSAPIKRRTKSGKRRAGIGAAGGLSGGIRSDGGDEEESQAPDGKSRRSGGRGRPLLQAKVPDVVTMVSLVSSADSDSDIDQNSPRDDKLIHELRNKLPTTPIIKTSSGCPAITVLRKPIKSVSFQQESFDCERDETPKEERKWGVVGVFGQQKFPVVCRGGGSALPTPEEATSWKTEDTIPALITLRSESKDHEDAFVAPITDREKRCLAVPIGDPIRDKKRRLLRTRSTPPRPYVLDEGVNSPPSSASDTATSRMRDQEASSEKTSTFPSMMNELSTTKTDERILETEIGVELELESGLTASEPQFQTTKERECWHLYRRMCDKGVHVSFDTVLRGMLTPTEYRLRQKDQIATPDC